MNVLLMLGNGFDLNLSLPTSYQDFYNYYLAKEKESSAHVQTLKNQLARWKNGLNSEKRNIIDWSDLELGLGEVTSLYQSPDDFWKAYYDISSELVNYLKSVCSLIQPDTNAIVTRFFDDIVRASMLTDLEHFMSEESDNSTPSDFHSYFDPKYAKDMSSYLATYVDRTFLNVDVMTFNYTNVVEQILDWDSIATNYQERIRFENVYHIHQELDEKGILLGVNHHEQIHNKTFREMSDFTDLFLKPVLNNEYASGIDLKCQKAIEKADVIIMFGLSLGQTDAFWWNYLAYSVNSYNKRIVYCPYDTEIITNTYLVVERNKKLIKHVLNNMNVTQQVYNNLMAKVYPIRHNQMFRFGLNNNLEENRKLVLDSLVPDRRPLLLR